MKSVFCGRDAELAVLQAAFEALAGPQPSPQIVVLLAEPGLGKTRLAQEFYHWLSTSKEVTPGPAACAMRSQERWLANGYDGQAGALFRLGRFAEAAEARHRSIEVREGIRDRLGANWTARENVYLAEIYLALADSLSRAGEAAEASDAATVAVNIWTETSLLHPELFTLHIRNSLERAKQLRMG